MEQNKKHHVTAIIYNKRGHVLSVGVNSYVKTHTMQARIAKSVGKPDTIYLHAEIDAIVRCKRLRSAVEIRVFRYGADGKARLAKPCVICESAIKASGIKRVVHT